jgi:hypothetical protein
VQFRITAKKICRLSPRAITPERLSAKIMPTLADRGYRVIKTTYRYGRSLGFVGREFSAIPTDNNYHFTEVVNKTQASGKMNKL